MSGKIKEIIDMISTDDKIVVQNYDMKVRKCLGSVEMAHIVRGAISNRCKFNVHGHSAEWFITVSSRALTDYGMVVDFIELKKYKKLVDIFDHCMVLWDDEEQKFKDFFIDNFKRVVVLKKNTTAENFARLLLKIASEDLVKEDMRLKVESVEYFETKSSEAFAYEYDKNDIIVGATYEIIHEMSENGLLELEGLKNIKMLTMTTDCSC